MLSKINSCCVTKSNSAYSQKSKRPNFTGMIKAGDLLIDAKKVYLDKSRGFFTGDCLALKNLATDNTLFNFRPDLKLNTFESKLNKAFAWAQSYEGLDILDLTNSKYGICKIIKNDFKPEV